MVTDVFTGQIGIMCAMPVYRDGRLAAVAGADLFLTGDKDFLESGISCPKIMTAADFLAMESEE